MSVSDEATRPGDDELDRFMRESHAEIRPITVRLPAPRDARYSRGIEVHMQLGERNSTTFDLNVGELQELIDAGQRLLKELGHG